MQSNADNNSPIVFVTDEYDNNIINEEEDLDQRQDVTDDDIRNFDDTVEINQDQDDNCSIGENSTDFDTYIIQQFQDVEDNNDNLKYIANDSEEKNENIDINSVDHVVGHTN
eukprot:13880129-Ditylum_brightwellii.AAC.1